MFSHDRIWAALDALADRHGLSPSGLARRAGLDPTTFNKSKRMGNDGRPRWPSTESIHKVMESTGATIDDFSALIRGEGPAPASASPAALPLVALRGGPAVTVPLVGLAQAGSGGYFDDAGFPAGQGWEEITLPATGGEPVYAIEVAGESMKPLYKEGDILIVAPGASVRRGDRVVARVRSGEVMVKTLERRTAKTIELSSVNPDFPPRLFAAEDVEWLARVLWASQ